MLVLISKALNAITAKYLLEQAQDAALVTDEDILNYEIDDQLGNYYASTIRVFLEMTRPLIGSVTEVCSENLDTDEDVWRAKISEKSRYAENALLPDFKKLKAGIKKYRKVYKL